MPRFLHPAMRQLAVGLFDQGRGIPDARLDWMLEDVGDFLLRAGKKTSILFGIVVFLIEWLPLFLIGRLGRFSRLPPTLAAQYLQKLDESRLSILIVLPKVIQGLCYYEHPDALAETGYDGTCLLGEAPAGTGLVQLGSNR